MQKQKSIGNKGFSLVELIIVIAIMAILVGVMAPQLLKYVERTRISSDTQFADTARTAVTTAILDPVNMNHKDYKTAVDALKTGVPLENLTEPLKGSVAETLGLENSNDLKDTWVKSQLKSSGANGITVKLVGSNNIVATVTGSSASGSGAGASDPITVGNTATTGSGTTGGGEATGGTN